MGTHVCTTNTVGGAKAGHPPEGWTVTRVVLNRTCDPEGWTGQAVKERGQEAAAGKLGWDTEARARRVASCEDLGPQELSRALVGRRLPGGQSPEVLPCGLRSGSTVSGVSSAIITCRGASRRPLTLSKASGPFTVKLQGKSPPHRRWSGSEGSRIRKGLVDGQASLSTPREDSGFTVRKEPGNGRLGSPSGLCCGAPGPAECGQWVLPLGGGAVLGLSGS